LRFISEKRKRAHPLAAPCQVCEQISRDNRDNCITPTFNNANVIVLQACIAPFAS
jgi:hypothetical protein